MSLALGMTYYPLTLNQMQVGLYLETSTRMEYYHLEHQIEGYYMGSNSKYNHEEWVFFPSVATGVRFNFKQFFFKAGAGYSFILSRIGNGREAIYDRSARRKYGRRFYDNLWSNHEYVVGSGMLLKNTLNHFSRNLELGYNISNQIALSVLFVKGGAYFTDMTYESVITYLKDNITFNEYTKLTFDNTSYGVRLTVNF